MAGVQQGNVQVPLRRLDELGGGIHRLLQAGIGREGGIQCSQKAAGFGVGQCDHGIGSDGRIGFAHKDGDRHAAQGGSAGDAVLVAGVQAQVQSGGGRIHARIMYGNIPYCKRCSRKLPVQDGRGCRPERVADKAAGRVSAARQQRIDGWRNDGVRVQNRVMPRSGVVTAAAVTTPGMSSNNPVGAISYFVLHT